MGSYIFAGWILCLICRTVIQLNLSFKTVKETFGTFRISGENIFGDKVYWNLFYFLTKTYFPAVASYEFKIKSPAAVTKIVFWKKLI